MLKVLYLILFYLIYRITDLVLLLVLLVQTLLNIFSGEPSQSIKEFGKSLGLYLKQISEFLSYASEDKPYPFSDWPDARTASILSQDEYSSNLTQEGSPDKSADVSTNDTQDKGNKQG